MADLALYTYWRKRTFVLGWAIAAVSLFGYAWVLWSSLRAATLPRVHVEGNVVPGGVAPDRAGGVVTALTYTGTVDVGCGDSFAGQGMVLLRYDRKGKCTWKKPIHGASAINVETATDGDIVLAADVYDNADFGFGPTPAFHSLAITRFDEAGKARWSRPLDARVAETTALRSRQTVAVAPDGSAVAVFVAVHNLADLGTGKLHTHDTARDAAVALLDGSTGKARWVRYLGSVSFGGVAFDPKGSVLVVGTFVGDMDIGVGAWRASGDDGDVFVAKLDAHGDTVFGTHLGRGDATCIAASDDGHVFIAGNYGNDQSLDLGGGALAVCHDGPCMFWGELDESGKHLHSDAAAGAKPIRITVGPSNTLLVAADLAKPALPFVLRFDRHAFFGTRRAEVHGTERVEGLALDSERRAVVLGRSTSTRTGADLRWMRP